MDQSSAKAPLRLNTETETPSTDKDQEEKVLSPSISRKKLLEAREKDEMFDTQTKQAVKAQLTRHVAESVVNRSMMNVLQSISMSTPRKKEDKEDEDII